MCLDLRFWHEWTLSAMNDSDEREEVAETTSWHASSSFLLGLYPIQSAAMSFASEWGVEKFVNFNTRKISELTL